MCNYSRIHSLSTLPQAAACFLVSPLPAPTKWSRGQNNSGEVFYCLKVNSTALGTYSKTKTTVFTRCTSTWTVRTPSFLLCSYPSLFSSSSHILTLQAVICWSQGPDLAKSLSVSHSAVTHLPDLLHSAAQNWAKHCHTFHVGTGCKLLPHFLDPPFLPSPPFNFVMLEIESTAQSPSQTSSILQSMRKSGYVLVLSKQDKPIIWIAFLCVTEKMKGSSYCLGWFRTTLGPILNTSMNTAQSSQGRCHVTDKSYLPIAQLTIWDCWVAHIGNKPPSTALKWHSSLFWQAKLTETFSPHTYLTINIRSIFHFFSLC